MSKINNPAIPANVRPYLAPPARLRLQEKAWIELTVQVAAQIGADGSLADWLVAAGAATQILLEREDALQTLH